ncbi:MAG: DUF748 domain-containing protein [Planctomycetes bacterium]|nr:DUF748 domain-containing protein [Planctomycetota bacterium]
MVEPVKRAPRRRWRIVVGATLLLLVAVRFGGVALLPTVADRVGEKLGLSIAWERLDLSLFGGSVELRRLDVRRRSDGAALFDLESLQVDADMSALLRGQLRVRRVELDGLHAKLARAEDGTVGLDGWTPPAPEPATSSPSADAAEPPPADGATTPADAPFDFTLPLVVELLRVQNVRVLLRDDAVEPPLVTPAALELHISDLGHPQRPTTLDLALRAPGVVERLELAVRAQVGGPSAQAQLVLGVRGVVAELVRRYAPALPLAPLARSIDVELAAGGVLQPVDATHRALTGRFDVVRAALLADDDEEFTFAAAVPVRELTRAGLHLGSVTTELRGRAARAADGALRAAGFVQTTPSEPPAPTTPAPPIAAAASARDAAAAPVGAVASAPFRLRIDELRPALHFAFHDATVEPPRDLVVELSDTALRQFDSALAADGPPMTLALRLTAPDVVLTAEGEIVPIGATQRGRLSFELALSNGLAQLAPYLAAAGIETTFRDALASGELHAALTSGADGATTLEGALGPLRLVEERDAAAGGDVERLALDSASVARLVIGPAAGALALQEFALRGVRVEAQREASGAWCAAGVRVNAPTGTGPSAGAVEPLTLAIDDVTLRLAGFATSGDPAAAPSPAQLAVAVKLRDLCDTLELGGSVAVRPTPFAMNTQLELLATGLRADAVAPLLREQGIEPELRAGELKLALAAELSESDGARRASLHVERLELRDGETELFGLSALRLPAIVQGEQGLALGAIELVEPRAMARRDAAGVLHAGGFAFGPPPARASGGTAAAASGAAPMESTAATEPAAEGAPGAPLSLAGLRVSGAHLRFDDAAVEPAVALDARVALEVGPLTLGSAQATPFEVEVQLADALDELAIAGDFCSDPRALGAKATVRARGVRAGPLAGWFPPDLALTTADGRLALAVEASLRSDDAGSRRAELAVRELSWRDGEAEPSLALDELRVTVPQLDLPSGPLVIESITSRGLVVRARRLDASRIALLGCEVRAAAPTVPTAPAVEVANVEAPIAEAPPAAKRVALELPERVQLGVVDLGVAEFRFEDATRPEAPPLQASFVLRHATPATLWSRDPAAIEPLRLELRASAAPALRELAIGLETTPFAPVPELTLTLDASGLSGPGLVAWLPQLAEQLDLAELADGTVHAKVEASAQVRRRGAAEIDFGAGFGAHVALRDFAMKATPESAPFLALESVEIDVAKVRPATGDVHVRTIEVHRPVAAVRQTADALEIGPLKLRRSPAAPPMEPPTTAPTASAEPPPGPEVRPAARPEFRIDELLVTGLDFTFRDETVTPPMVLPLTDLEVEVRRFTTRAFTEARPIAFRVALEAGALEFERRDAGSLLGGFLRAAAGAVTGGNDAPALEQRPAFDLLELNGSLALFPAPTGFARLDIGSLELQAFEGPAAAAGIEIGDGLLDTRVLVQLLGIEGMRIDSDTTLTSLSISEPPNGPIATYLKLPAPLDSILFLLRDEEGATRLPVRFDVPSAGMEGHAIARLATETLARLIADAVAGAPMRVVSGALDVVQLQNVPGLSSLPGLGSLLGKTEPLPFDGTPIVVALEPGSGVLPTDALARLEPLLAQLRADPSLSVVVDHQLGGGDVERLEQWSRPSDDDLAELARKLRTRRATVDDERAVAAAAARVAIGSGDEAAATAARESLRGAERELARIEEALEATLALHGDARRGVAQRVRASAKALAAARLAAARELLMGAAVESIGTRLQVKRARATPPLGDGGGVLLFTPRPKTGAR